MNARKLVLTALLGMTLFAVLLGAACAPAPTPVPTAVPPTAAPAKVAPTTAPAAPTSAPAAAFDIKPVLDKYISNLPDNFGTIAPAALKDQMASAKVFLLDVREPKEVADNGFIEGAVNIPMRTLTKNLDKLPAKDQPIVSYCAIGHRGAAAMMTLQLLGYTNVKSIVGGFSAWKDAKLPVATGTPPAPVAGKAPDVDKDLFAALDKYVSNMPDSFYGIAPAALNDQIAAAKPFLLDVRETKEVADNGTIAGSVNIPIRSTFKDFAKLPQDKAAPIVTYCAIGHRGAMEMMTLQLLGYTNVKSLLGGFGAWKTANLPITGAPAASAPTAPTAAVATAFDIKPVLDKYLSNLPDGWSTIAPAAMNDQLSAAKPFVVDVRETGEYATGFVAGSVNIPIRTLMKNLDKLPAKDQPIIVMCGSGHRSALGMEALQLLGYTNVKSLAGGFGAWKTANLPVATTMPVAPTAGKAPDVDKNLLAALDKYFSGLPDGWQSIAPTALNDLLSNAKPFQLEVRETKEVADNGYIAGSTNIPLRTLVKNLDKLPQDKSTAIITECGSGHRSAMTMMALNLLGYTNVKSMAGGFAAWKAANLPIAKVN